MIVLSYFYTEQKMSSTLKRKYEKISQLYENEKSMKEKLNEKIINLKKELEEEQNKFNILDESVTLKKEISFGLQCKLFIYEKEFEPLGFFNDLFDIIFEYSLTEFLCHNGRIYLENEFDATENSFYLYPSLSFYNHSTFIGPTKKYQTNDNVCRTCGNNIEDMDHTECTTFYQFGYFFGCRLTTCFVISSGVKNVPFNYSAPDVSFSYVFQNEWDPYDLKNLFVTNTKCEFQIYEKEKNSYFKF